MIEWKKKSQNYTHFTKSSIEVTIFLGNGYNLKMTFTWFGVLNSHHGKTFALVQLHYELYLDYIHFLYFSLFSCTEPLAFIIWIQDKSEVKFTLHFESFWNLTRIVKYGKQIRCISGICFQIWISIEIQKNNIHTEDRISEKRFTTYSCKDFKQHNAWLAKCF